MALIEHDLRYAQVDVNLSISFTVDSKFVPTCIESIVKALPLTSSLEVQVSEVMPQMTFESSEPMTPEQHEQFREAWLNARTNASES